MLKYLSLILLTAQNAMVILVMRYVRTRGGEMFMATSAVVMSEVLKFTSSLLIIFYQQGSVRRWLHHLHENIILQPGRKLQQTRTQDHKPKSGDQSGCHFSQSDA
jgi:UDP-sugar transporter A1/2/3